MRNCRTSASVHYDCPGYRLPTDAEWEYAARAGTRTPFYLGPFTYKQQTNECVDEPFLTKAGWYCFNAGASTHPAKQVAPNAWGLFDMLGNLFEWTSDAYATRDSYDGSPLVDPGATIATAGEWVTLRGGSIVAEGNTVTVSRRSPNDTTTRGIGYGFRVVRTLNPADAGAR